MDIEYYIINTIVKVYIRKLKSLNILIPMSIDNGHYVIIIILIAINNKFIKNHVKKRKFIKIKYLNPLLHVQYT